MIRVTRKEIPHHDILRIETDGFERVTGFPQPTDFDRAYFYGSVEEFLRRESIPFVNLERAYRAAGVDPKSLYGCTHHWNKEGHRVTAEIVAQKMRDDFNLPSRSAS